MPLSLDDKDKHVYIQSYHLLTMQWLDVKYIMSIFQLVYRN